MRNCTSPWQPCPPGLRQSLIFISLAVARDDQLPEGFDWKADVRVKKFPADEEAMKQLLQELKKKIVETLQPKDSMEEFLDCRKEKMHDDKVPKTILVRDRILRDPARRGRS